MKRTIVKVSLILIIALSLGVILWDRFHGNESSPPISPERKTSTPPLRIKGLSHSAYFNDKLIARIEADEFKVNQRRFWVFNIRPFNEVTLTNAKLEVHFYEEMPSEADMFSFAKDILSLNKKGKSDLKGMGLITRGVIKNLTLEVYKAEKLSMVVRARKAYIDFRRNKTRFEMADIEDVVSKKRIKSKSGIWNNKEKVFVIPGDYVVQTPEGRASGRGIKIDLNFTVTPL